MKNNSQPSLSSSTPGLSENASWRTRFSSDDEFEYPSIVCDQDVSNYVWDTDNRTTRSISSLSVMTAEPIDYDCTQQVDFEPAEVTSSHCSSCSCSSIGPLPSKRAGDAAGNIKKNSFSPSDLTAVESAIIHQYRSQKDPPSYYHVMDLNPGPIDMAPRLTNVSSQYQVQDMYEFSALQPAVAAKLNKLVMEEETNGEEENPKEVQMSIGADHYNGGGDAVGVPRGVHSSYFSC